MARLAAKSARERGAIQLEAALLERVATLASGAILAAEVLADLAAGAPVRQWPQRGGGDSAEFRGRSRANAGGEVEAGRRAGGDCWPNT